MPLHRRDIVLLPLVVAIVVLAVWVGRHVGWATLGQHQDELVRWVSANPVIAAGLFLLAYILTAALSLPNAAILSVAGGLLFGPIVGCTLTVTGATIGASLLLLAARSALGDRLTRRGGAVLAGVRDRLARDGFSYLLALRLMPLVPFWVVNLAAAVCGMRLGVFVLATALGIVPASFVLCSIGSGIGGVLAAGRTPDLSVLFAPRLLLPLLGLAVLSFVPVFARRYRRPHA